MKAARSKILLTMVAQMSAVALAIEEQDVALRLLNEPPSLVPSYNPQHSLRLERIASGFTQPIYVVAPPGDSRLFVLEKAGRIMIIANGAALPTPFLDLSEVIDSIGERGLLGLAFEPDYATSRRFYVCYSEVGSTNTIVSRFTVSDDPNVAVRTSEQRLLTIPQVADRGDHKAGWIGFRPGEPTFLYIATGDGGGSNDPDNSSQDLRSNRGKILRIDVSGSGTSYAIPADNPFAKSGHANPEIWAYGLRNPYRMSFDRLTGDLFIGDVGQDTAEEINFEEAGTPGGRNYGWRPREGGLHNAVVSEAAEANTVDPIFYYRHSSMMTTRGAVIGGYVYRGRAMPEWYGTYFFADFTNAAVRSFRYTGREITQYTDHSAQINRDGQLFFFSSVTSFGEDADGELLLVDFTGSIFRLVR